MSIYNDLSKVKRNNNNESTKTLIKTQKLHNLLLLIFFSSLLLIDLIFIIKGGIVGIPGFSKAFLIISIVFEALVFIILLLFKFNTEKVLFKIIFVIIFSLPIIAYIALFSYDTFSIVFFILRLLALIIFLNIILKSNSNNLSHYKIRNIMLLFGSITIIILALLLLIIVNDRRIKYSYDKGLNGYVVEDVLDGSANVNFKDDTVKINDNSLTNVSGDLVIPNTVKEISDNAFKDSNINSIHISSDNISLANAVNNSNINLVYIDNKNTEINDIENINNPNVKLVLSKDNIDEYRLNHKDYETLFIPKTETDEYYVIYYNTSLKTEYYKKGTSFYLAYPRNQKKSRFIGWTLNGEKFNDNYVTIEDNLEFTALWSIIYTYTFDYNNGTLVSSNARFNNLPESLDLVKEDGNLVLPELEKENYRFDGWYDKDLYTDETPLKDIEIIDVIDTNDFKDTNLKAHFSKKYQLIYHTNGGTLSGDLDEELVDGEEITPLTPTREGFTFDGWYLDSNLYSDTKVTTVNKAGTELYAKWILNAPIVTLSEDINKVYDANPSEISISLSHPLIDSLNISISWFKNNSSSSFQTNRYSYTITNAEKSYYYCRIKAVYGDYSVEIETDHINVNIEKADYDLSSVIEKYENKTIELEFNGQNQKPIIDNLPIGIDGISLKANYNYSKDIINVGDDNKVTVSFISESNNYNTPSSISFNAFIINKLLTLDKVKLTNVYDGMPFKPVINIIGAVDGYPVELIINGEAINASKFNVNLSISDNNNYILEETVVECEILKADYEISLNDLYELTYNGTSQIPDISLPDGLSIDKNNSEGVKNAGNYDSVIIYLINSNNNYNDISEIKVNIRINKKTITVNLVDNQEFIYNGNIQTPKVEFSGVVAVDNISYNVLNDSINAGSYIAIIELDNNNYYISNVIEYEILKADYEISLSNSYELTYNGISQIPSISLPDGLSIDSSKTQGVKDVGTYNLVDIYLTNSNNNYNDLEKISINIKVNTKSLIAKSNKLEFTYNGKKQIPELEFEGIIAGDSVEYDISNNSKNAGTYKANILISNNNYYISNVIEYKILKADYEISLNNLYELTYNGISQIPEITLPNGLAINNNKTQGVKDAGIHNLVDIYLTNSNNNYNDLEKVSINIKINPKSILAKSNNLELTYNGFVQTPELEFEGIINDDIINYVVNNNDSINVGTYKANITINNNNYYISNELEYRIIKADYEISLKNLYELTYNGISQIPEITLPSGLTIDSSKTQGVKDTGTHNLVDIYLTNSNNNYNDLEKVSINIKINPKSITVNSSKLEFTYNGLVQTPELEFEGIINNDVINYTVNNDSKIVGTYKANISISNNNYYISNELEYEIKKADLENITYTVSGFNYTYDGDSHSPVVSGSNCYASDGSKILYECDSFKDSGSYTARVRYYVDGDNYNDSISSYDFVIEKRALTLEFDDLTHEYNNEYYRPTITNIVGLVSGDDFEVTILNTNAVQVGNYKLIYNVTGNDKNNYDYSAFDNYEIVVYGTKITISGFEVVDYVGTYDGEYHYPTVTGLDSKYTAVYSTKYKNVIDSGEVEISFKSSDVNELVETVALGHVTINKKEIGVSLDNNSLTYNGNIQYPNITLNGIVEGDSVDYDLSSNTSKNQGEYTLSITLLNSNYMISSSSNLDYEITASAVSISWSNLELEYTKTPLKPNAYVSGMDVEVIVTTTENNILVGHYTAYASIDDTNYIVSNNTMEYDIIPAKLSVSWSNYNLFYNGENQKPQALVTPFTGDICNVTVKVYNSNDLELDSYSVPNSNYYAKASIDNTNYQIYENGTREYVIQKGNLDYDTISSKIIEETVLTYNGNIQYPNVKNPSTKIYAIDGSEIIITKNGIKNVGTHTLDLVFSTENGYYNNYAHSVTLIIEALELDIEITDTELKYDNTIKIPSFNIKNINGSDNCIVKITNTNVSVENNIKAIFTITGDDASNYKITNEYYYSIVKGDLDLSDIVITNTSVTYNGNTQLPIITNYPYEGISIDLDNSIGVINVIDTIATIYFSLSDELAMNWNTPDSMNIDMIVNAKNVSISFIITSFGYDGLKHLPTYEIDGLVLGDSLELTFENDGGIDRGNYEVDVIGVSNANYVLDKEYTASYEITYGTYDMSGIEANNITVKYNGKVRKVMAIEGELPDGVTVSYSYENDPINVGEYKVTISFTGDSNNYNSIPNMEAYVIIEAYELALNWSNTQLTYNGNLQAPSAIIAGSLFNSDTCDIEITGGAINAGTHTASATLSNLNYIASNNTTEYTIKAYEIPVVITCGTQTGYALSFTFDGKIHNNITITYDNSYLLNPNDELTISANTSNIKAAVGIYSFSLVFSNKNYTASTITGTLQIKKLEITQDAGINWVDQDGSLPYATIEINNEIINFNDLSAYVKYTYYTYTYEWMSSSYQEISAPTEAGKYAVCVDSISEDNITITHNSIWSYHRFTYAPSVTKEVWSNDGQYNSTIFKATGNTNTKDIVETFTYDNENYSLSKALKLESDSGKLSFTITEAKTLVLFMTNGSTFKLNGNAISYTDGTPYEIELEAGSYEVTKGSGSTLLYGAIIE